MFEAAEVGNELSKQQYNKLTEVLRGQLLEAQWALAKSKASVVIIVSGAEGAGKQETIDLLHEWMDARGLQTRTFWEESDEERKRPRFWRFWRQLPPHGKIGIFFGSWYTRPIVDLVYGNIKQGDFEHQMRQIVEFERMLAHENVVLVKLWMHLSKDAQKKRLKKLAKDKRTRWRVSKNTWKFFEQYDEFRAVSERALEQTSMGFAPWTIIEAADKRYRNWSVADTLLKALQQAVEQANKPKKLAPDRPKTQPRNVINSLDMTQKLAKNKYEEELEDLQGELAVLARKMAAANKSMVLAFEGPDAAGKGGAIRRVTAALDARQYAVHGIAAPTDEEAARPYLWRFWRHVPAAGRIAIFDRSWYGRVLVERVEGFCEKEAWQRAYSEINDFESQLNEAGTLVLKFWLATTADEQLRRFKDRQQTPYKQYKLTPEDWRNRDKWNAYEAAACEAIERTSGSGARWYLIEANDKYFARVKVVRTIVENLKQWIKD